MNNSGAHQSLVEQQAVVAQSGNRHSVGQRRQTVVHTKLLGQLLVLLGVFLGGVTRLLDRGTLGQQPQVVDESTQGRQRQNQEVEGARLHGRGQCQQQGTEDLTGKVSGEHHRLQLGELLARELLEHQGRHDVRVEHRAAKGDRQEERVPGGKGVKSKTGDELHS